MNITALHHVEMCVTNGKNIVSYYIEKLGFSLRAWRDTNLSQQWVIGSQKATFVVTERKNPHKFEPVPFSQFCCEHDSCHTIDSVFNVALEVKNVDFVTAKMQQSGAKLIQPVTEIRDENGIIRFSVVSSCCGNIIHTLLDKSQYSGPFLPTFNLVKSKAIGRELITHVDHITFVCYPGDSVNIVNWYEKCLGMKKFRVNATEDLKEGLVIKDGVGMRLRVIDYWPCAETGIYQPNNSHEEKALRIVLAESLPEQENSHIGAFLKGHRGPGLQHIGLHTTSIIKCVDYMAKRNVSFRKPPNAYYENKIMKGQIEAAGFDVEKFQELGILLDSEADIEVDDSKNRFLLQIFTLPLFEEETFFLEVVQRQGARGFGAGNVTALARSIEEERRKFIEIKN